MKHSRTSLKAQESKKDNVDWDLVRQFEEGLEDLKHGRYELLRPGILTELYEKED